MCTLKKNYSYIFFLRQFRFLSCVWNLYFSVPCRVLFRIVLSFSYPFPWHISRVFFPLSLPGHIRCRFLRSLLKKSEETRAQFPHLPLLSHHPCALPFLPLVFVAFLAFLLHSTCVSCFFALLIRNVADSPQPLSHHSSSCLLVAKCLPIKCNLFANVSICAIATPLPLASWCSSSDPLWNV